MPRLITTVLRTALDGAWFERRDAVIAKMIGASSASARRIQFDAQLIAEVAGYAGDVETCVAMIERAARAGAFDLHWLDRCPLLEVARGPALDVARRTIHTRACAILDALYGDADADATAPA